MVRRTTLTTLIHLLQEDYLKMTAGFFFRILQTMCDEEDEIKVTTFLYLQLHTYVIIGIVFLVIIDVSSFE